MIKYIRSGNMKIVKLTNNPDNTNDAVFLAINALNKGGLVIYPTETVYGIGADATNQNAIDKLLNYKSRREGKPLSIAVTDQAMAKNFVELNDQAIQFYQRFLPGPYTIVSKDKGKLAKGVASEFSTLGIRVSSHPLINKLVEGFTKPITATSANSSGKKRPYSILDILDNISDKQKNLIDLIIDAGTLPKNEPSIVIDTTHSTPLTLRSQIDIPEKSVSITSISDQETKEIAGKLLLKNWERVNKRGLVIALDGELGAGKTVFAKGVANFLQIDQQITSPTYTYIKEYEYSRHQTNGIFYHLDLWRLDDEELAKRLRIEELVKKNNVIVIEWWDQAKQFLNNLNPDIFIQLDILENEQRKLIISEQK